MLEFVVEPYLIQIGFVLRTPRGRILTPLVKVYFDSKHDKFYKNKNLFFLDIYYVEYF